MNLTVLPITNQQRPDFYRVHCEAYETGWCHCIAWWVPTWDGWGERTADQNKALRDQLFDQGQYDGYLLYADNEPVGWCQVGQRDRLTKLVQQYALVPDPAVWAVTCFVIIPSHRGQGLAHHLLETVLQDLVQKGVSSVQAFPRRGEDMEAGEVWTGPETLFIKAGFTLERPHPTRPIYRKKL